MAISPPSDILLDVANAADPAQVRMATARLAKLAADPSADAAFSQSLSTATDATKPFAKATLAAPPTTYRQSEKGPAAAYQKFEAVLLQNFVESMMPKSDELYGDKESAGVYRSMMAEQLATQIAKAGGIGIAKSLASKHPPQAQAAAAPVMTPVAQKGSIT